MVAAEHILPELADIVCSYIAGYETVDGKKKEQRTHVAAAAAAAAASE